MDRRRFLQVSGSTGAGLFLGMSNAAAAQARSVNVVMIVSDDQGWPDFGFMGHEVIRTPRLDRLARDSARFPRGYVPTSLCRASLATLLTGLFPYQHNICCNDPPDGVDRSRMHPFIKTAPCIPRLLGQQGYRSLQTGKFWEGHFSNAGFTSGETTNADRHISRKQPQIGRTTMQPIYNFIDENRERPFFVWYAPLLPHQPHNPPERFLKHYAVQGRDRNVARYYAMCEWFDETCGQLLDHLTKRNLDRDTLVVFVVDNGWTQTTEDQKRTSYGAERGKRSPYEMGIRTPILLRWPGHTKPADYNDLVITVDLAPTILQATGTKIPAQMKGVSLLNTACGKGGLQRTAIFGEIYVHTATKLGTPDLDVTHRWTREGDWKLILPLRGKNRRAELFNVTRDPHERTDLAAKEPNRVKTLTQSIAQWVANR